MHPWHRTHEAPRHSRHQKHPMQSKCPMRLPHLRLQLAMVLMVSGGVLVREQILMMLGCVVVPMVWALVLGGMVLMAMGCLALPM